MFTPPPRCIAAGGDTWPRRKAAGNIIYFYNLPPRALREGKTRIKGKP